MTPAALLFDDTNEFFPLPPLSLPSVVVVVGLAAVGAVGLAGWAVLRWIVRRRLAARVVYEVIPAEDFDPSPEDIRRFAATLEQTRPATWSWAPRPARAVRLRLTVDGGDGLVRYLVEAHRTAVVFPPYPGVEFRRVDTPAGLEWTSTGRSTRSSGSEAPEDRVARAEYVLAADSALPLRGLPLRPDPLQALAAAVTDIHEGERVDVCLDLLPLTRAKVAHLARRRTRTPTPAGTTGAANVSTAGRQVWGMLNGHYPRSPSAKAGHATPTTADRGTAGGRTLQGERGKLTGAEPTFAAQLLVRATTPADGPGRARARRHVQAVHGVLDGWAGEHNRWRVAGTNLGVAHIDGADSRWRRRAFDRRWRTGEFRPRNMVLLCASEITGVLKPATKHCQLRNVARLAGVFPAPPRDLPTYTSGRRDLLPLGFVTGTDGNERLVGAPLEETTFSLRAGKSGCGKTELALVQAVALARSGHGVWFLDPHRDGWERARAYLADDHLRDRVWEIDLSSHTSDAYQCGWNPLSMQGRGRDDIPAVAGAVSTALTAASGWGESANRARTILVKACETLCELGMRLPADAQPTVFQIRTLLHDPDWRTAVTRYVSDELQDYWETSFPSYAAGAAAVVTNIIDTLASSVALRGLLGQTTSTYDARTAMDTGKAVFLCPAGTGTTDRLITCLLVFDLFRAAAGRLTAPPDARRPVHAFVDELTLVDGAARGTIAAIVEQLRKYGVRAHFMTQMASRLTPTTRSAVMQNASILATSAAEIDAAQAITRQWATYRVTPGSITSLPAYHHAVSVTLARRATGPFLVRGPQLGVDLFADDAKPERLAALDETVTRNLARRPIGEVTAELDQLDDRIHTLLTYPTDARGARGGAGGGETTGNRSGGVRVSGRAFDLQLQSSSPESPTADGPEAAEGSTAEVGDADRDGTQDERRQVSDWG